VELIDEQDDLGAGLGLIQDLLEALLELTAVLGAGDDGGEVEHDEALALEHLGDFLGDDALGQALGDGGFANAGLTDEHGVVLGAAVEDGDDAGKLGFAAHHGVELALSRALAVRSMPKWSSAGVLDLPALVAAGALALVLGVEVLLVAQVVFELAADDGWGRPGGHSLSSEMARALFRSKSQIVCARCRNRAGQIPWPRARI
jgi:hypothetical protein